MAQIEMWDMRHKFQGSSPNEKAPYPDMTGWNYFIHMRQKENDWWHRRSNLNLKTLLDMDVPVKGFTMASAMQGAALAGNSRTIMDELELLFLEHLNRYQKEFRANLQKTMVKPGPNLLDYLLLMENMGQANLLHSVQFLAYMQGDYAGALDRVNVIYSIYQDHPVFTQFHARVLQRTRSRKKGPARANLVNDAVTKALNALYWAGGANHVSADALNILYILDYGPDLKASYTPEPDSAQKPAFANWRRMRYYMRRDFPISCAYDLNFGTHEGAHEYWLDWTHDDFRVVRRTYDKLANHFFSWDKDRKCLTGFLGKLKNRFHGHPGREHLLAEYAARFGDPSDAEKLYKAQIKTDPRTWTPYFGLGDLYVKQGRYEEAKNVYLSYPLFHSLDRHKRVKLSNASYSAGARLFWSGAIEQAEPLFRISADLKTGSNAGIAAEAKLALCRGDFQRAAQIQQYRARRYDSVYAYRDFMCLLFLMGESEMAWSLFDNLQGRYATPQIWSAALMGHRMNNISREELAAWLKNKAEKKGREWLSGFVARYAILQLMDRPPDLELAELAGKLGSDIPVYGIMQPYEAVAKAYTHIKMGNYSTAFKLLNVCCSSSYFRKPLGNPVFALLVRSWIKAPDPKHGGKAANLMGIIPRNLNEEKEGCFYYVAKAQVLVKEEKYEQAVELMKKAFNLRPHMKKQMIHPMYLMAEFCEWFYEDSGYEPFRDLLLDWVGVWQKLCPWTAWAYSFEAKWARDTEAQLRALAIANYLNPQSLRISGFSKEQKAKAENWMNVHKPFSPDRPKKGA